MILGVDPGIANCGWALVEGGQLRDYGCIVTRRGDATGDAQRRLEQLGRVLHGKLFGARLVVVEWPGFGGARRPGAMNAMAASQTAAAAALVMGLAWSAGRKVRAPAAVTWRLALGHARGQDEQLHLDLAARYDLGNLTAAVRPHVLDAIGLALYGELMTCPAQQRLASDATT